MVFLFYVPGLSSQKPANYNQYSILGIMLIARIGRDSVRKEIYQQFESRFGLIVSMILKDKKICIICLKFICTFVGIMLHNDHCLFSNFRTFFILVTAGNELLSLAVVLLYTLYQPL